MMVADPAKVGDNAFSRPFDAYQKVYSGYWKSLKLEASFTPSTTKPHVRCFLFSLILIVLNLTREPI